ncbi:MAG: ABC-F family ATP-binding cassette domain-containing protein [Solirubrobacterales bacterium]|nr:ABC-F family ATP-binding cassette domain-containing protein [Solirubrobacterales bacterium]MCB8914978.1 ABC-F family ATP-binding cassette domain-containing protein [Thermoleophilales bacterium]
MAVITATNLGIHMGGDPLFSDVSFKLMRGDRMTLSGRNGAGKSTLLRILAGEAENDSGSLSYQKGVRVALHDQRPPRDRGLTLTEYVFSGRADVIATEVELERLEKSMSEGDHGEETMRAYAAAQQRLELAGGYRWRDEVLLVLRGLGFAENEFDRPLSGFSGGELTRASLARALGTRADLLLLDEPTNHLDIPTLEWLEEYLKEVDASVVLVAHDRWFLESVGTSVLELEAGRARYFSGPWHAWRKEQAARQVALGKQIERQQAEIARMERFVERFRYKATKARQAQSRVKQIEKVKKNAAAMDPQDRRILSFDFVKPERASRVVLKLVNGRIEVPGRVLLDDGNLILERDEHVVLVGPNGAGKTTLMATLAGERKPAAGHVRLGHNAKVGYLSQHAETASGDGTVLDAAARETGLSGQKVRDLLGAFLFSGEDANKQLSDISGGEQRRLSLAILVASGANLLLLDEPTNHLDIESREALEDALLGFPGALILISHDRALLEAVGSRTLVCEGGALSNHMTGWAEYQKRRDEEEEKESAAAQVRPATKSDNARRGGSPGKEVARTRRRVENLEKKIETAEARLADLEDELADPAAWSTPEKSEAASSRHDDAKAKVASLYAEWEEADRLARETAESALG